jgi:hypothetical protein
MKYQTLSLIASTSLALGFSPPAERRIHHLSPIRHVGYVNDQSYSLRSPQRQAQRSMTSPLFFASRFRTTPLFARPKASFDDEDDEDEDLEYTDEEEEEDEDEEADGKFETHP